MARCRATTPCEFYNDVHDYGCPERGTGYANPDLNRLYATETSGERALLDEVLTQLIDRMPAPPEAGDRPDPDDVTGGEPEWLALRTAVRAHAHLADANPAQAVIVAAGLRLEWDDEADAPALRITA